MNPLDGAAGMLRDILRDKLVNCCSFYIDNYDENGMLSDCAWLTSGDVVSIVYYIDVNINLQIKAPNGPNGWFRGLNRFKPDLS